MADLSQVVGAEVTSLSPASMGIVEGALGETARELTVGTLSLGLLWMRGRWCELVVTP